MGKLVGIDYGQKRCGLAITDELQIIASPLETVETAKVMQYLEDLLQRHEVDALVLGEPTYSDGSYSETTRKVHAFRDKLHKKFPQTPIHLEDEAHSSQQAVQSIRLSGVKKKKRRDRSLVDKVAAALILKAYMDKTNI